MEKQITCASDKLNGGYKMFLYTHDIEDECCRCCCFSIALNWSRKHVSSQNVNDQEAQTDFVSVSEKSCKESLRSFKESLMTPMSYCDGPLVRETPLPFEQRPSFFFDQKRKRPSFAKRNPIVTASLSSLGLDMLSASGHGFDLPQSPETYGLAASPSPRSKKVAFQSIADSFSDTTEIVVPATRSTLEKILINQEQPKEKKEDS